MIDARDIPHGLHSPREFIERAESDPVSEPARWTKR